MGRTAKVKTAGRFGSRYGVGIRKRVIKVEEAQKSKHKCPECGFAKVKRVAPGIFNCNKCGSKFTGGAYIPETMSGSIVRKMVTQKALSGQTKERPEVRQEKPISEEVKEKPKTEEKAKKAEKKEETKEEKAKEKKKAPAKKALAKEKEEKKPAKKKAAPKKKAAKKAK